jgi:hypothetical protein
MVEHSGVAIKGVRRGGIDARESDDPGNDAGLGMAFTAQ